MLRSFELPAFERTLGETTYRVDATPAYLAVAGAAICLALLVFLVMRAQRAGGALVSPSSLALAVVFAGVPAFYFVTRRLPLWGGGGTYSATRVFHDAIVLEGAAAGIGFGCVVAASLVLALRDEGQLALLRVALPCLVIGTAVASVGRHADAIAEAGLMPFYEVPGRREMHVGRERDVPVQLMRDGWHGWFISENGPRPMDDKTAAKWTSVKRVHVSAKTTGKVYFVARAHRGPVMFETKLDVTAVPEIASPLLSLRVGDGAVYRVRARSSDGALLYFARLAGHASESELRVDVTETREREGLRTFVLVVTHDGSRREVEVVALGGETREYDPEHGIIGKPVVGFAGDTGGTDPVPCSFALLGAPDALCQRGGRPSDVPASATLPYGANAALPSRSASKDDIARPPVAFAGAAPATFTQHTSSTAGTLATVFVALITIGLVILPDGSSSTSYTLVSTHRGAEGAPEAPPS